MACGAAIRALANSVPQGNKVFQRDRAPRRESHDSDGAIEC